MPTRSHAASSTQTTVRPAGPGRPRDLVKRAAILDAAKRLFTQHGFDGTSMDQIAAAAAVSKFTVYSHFGDKDTLFQEAIRAKCEEMLPADLFPADLSGPLEKQLRVIARAFFALITSEEALSLHRMMLAQSSDLHVRQMFWQAGPQRVKDVFAGFLRARVAAGDLQMPDVELAAMQFFHLLKGEIHDRMLMGLDAKPRNRALEAQIAATVDLFLRLYATR